MSRFSRVSSILLSVAAAVAAPLANAQAPRPASAQASKPAHGCKKPETPGPFTSATQMRGIRQDMDAFKTCINNYVQQQQALVKRAQEDANAAVDEYNAAVKEFNEAVGASSASGEQRPQTPTQPAPKPPVPGR